MTINVHPMWACLFYSDYYTLTPNPIGDAETPIKTLRPTNPSSKCLCDADRAIKLFLNRAVSLQ